MFAKTILKANIAILIAAMSLYSSHLWAQPAGGESNISPDYDFEIAPLAGKNLPYDLWGTPGTLNVLGIRTSMRLPNPSGNIEASFLFHHRMPDKAYTSEIAYRHEVYSNILNGYFSIGIHYSYFSLEPDRDSDGNCVLPGCVTDTGSHSGLTYGGGLLIPIGEYPIKLGLRFYQNPQSWLLLEIGYGIRF